MVESLLASSSLSLIDLFAKPMHPSYCLTFAIVFLVSCVLSMLVSLRIHSLFVSDTPFPDIFSLLINRKINMDTFTVSRITRIGGCSHLSV